MKDINNKFKLSQDIDILKRGEELPSKKLDYSYFFTTAKYIIVNDVYIYLKTSEVLRCTLGKEYLKITILAADIKDCMIEVPYSDLNSIDIHLEE